MTINSQSASAKNPVFPDIKVKLSGHDGNIFAVLATVRKALKKHGVSGSDQSQFVNEAITSNCYKTALNASPYTHLFKHQHSMTYINVVKFKNSVKSRVTENCIKIIQSCNSLIYIKPNTCV